MSACRMTRAAMRSRLGERLAAREEPVERQLGVVVRALERDPAPLRRGEMRAREDERHVRERLGAVAERLAARRVDLLRIQADLVRETEEPREERVGRVEPARVRQAVEEPERAEEEGPLAALET